MIARVLIVVSILILLPGCTNRQTANGKKENADPPISRITYTGGTGESFTEAVKIGGVRNQAEGIAAEYKFISDKHGPRGTGWFLVGQTVIREKNKIVDVIEIQLGDSPDRRIYYFEASEFLTIRR